MISDEDGNIINTFGAASNVVISAGDLTGYSGVHKYGAVWATNGSDWNTIWTHAPTTALYPWSTPSGTITVQSTGADNGDVTISGLDLNFEPVSETLTLTNTTPVAGQQVFTRINRAYMEDATNVGTILVKIGTTVVTTIEGGYGQTLQSFYTIPAGKTGYMLSWYATASKNQETVLGFFQRPEGGAFRITSTMSLYQNNYSYEYPVPIKFTEKTDLDVRVRGSSNALVTSEYTIVLVDNE
jgi:hypothetical protein